MSGSQLLFNVDKQHIRRIDRGIVAANVQNCLFAKFEFSEEWNEFEEKYATFKKGNKTYVVSFTEDSCVIPWEVLKPGKFYVGVYAGDRYTSDTCEINVSPSGYDENVTDPKSPTITIYDDLKNRVSDIETLIYGDGGIDMSGYVNDPNYVHTDNNYTTEEKQKLKSLKNITKVSELENDVDFVDVHGLESYAKKTDIPSLDGYAKVEDLESLDGYAKIEDIPSLEGYAKVEQIPSLDAYAKKNEIPSLDGYAKLIDIPNLDGYAKTEDIPSLDNYATKQEIPSLDGYAKKTDIPSLDGYAKTEDLESLDGYAKIEDIPSLDDYVKSEDVSDVVSNYINEHKDEFKGEKGDAGNSGVYEGTEAPNPEEYPIWIDLNDDDDNGLGITQLPPFTSADNGKVLGIINGMLAWVVGK